MKSQTPPGSRKGRTPQSAPQKPRKPRKDSLANRQRLLEAAREVFAEQGVGATLDDVAHHAGLGVGTAYRHFANKHVLIDGLFDDRIETFVEFAGATLEDSDPWEGFAAAMTRLAEDLVEIRALHDLVLDPNEGVPAPPDALGQTMTALLERGQQAGAIRKDLTATDLMTIQSMVDAAAERDPENWHRFLEILLDGIHCRG